MDASVRFHALDRQGAYMPLPHSRRCVLSRAPALSALLKTRRIVVKHSRSNWINIRGQVKDG